MSNSLQPHGLQHAMLTCPSLSPTVCSNSYRLSRWCHPTISSSVAPFSSCPYSFPASGSFPMSSTRWPKYWSFSFSISPSNEYSGLVSFRIDWCDLLTVQETLKSLRQYHNFKASILQRSAFFMVQLLYLYMTTGKTIALTTWTFDGKVMSLLFNTLSRFVIAFLLRSKHLLISCCSHHPQSFWSLRRENLSASTFSLSISHKVMRPDAMILVFLCWFLSQIFHSLSPLSGGFLVPLHFLPLEWYHLHIWGCWYFSWQSWFPLVTHPAQHFALCTLHIS